MSTQTPTPGIAELAPLIGTWRMDAVFADGRHGPPEDAGGAHCIRVQVGS
jgi:hypothetical protein